MWRISGKISFSIASFTAPLRTRHGNQHFAARRPRRRPAHDRRRTDVQVTQVTKDLAEAVEFLFQETADHFIGSVPRRNSGAAVDDHSIDIAPAQSLVEQLFDFYGFIFNDAIACRFVRFVREEFLDRLAAGIGAFVAGIADGNDETANAFLALFFMLVNRHRASPQNLSSNHNNTGHEFKGRRNGSNRPTSRFARRTGELPAQCWPTMIDSNAIALLALHSYPLLHQQMSLLRFQFARRGGDPGAELHRCLLRELSSLRQSRRMARPNRAEHLFRRRHAVHLQTTEHP